LATPLHVATLAAVVSSGTWRSPRLIDPASAMDPMSVVQHAAPALNPCGRSSLQTPPVDQRSGPALDPRVRSQLQTLLRAAVTEGTGRALASVPSAAGKTGTAEYGTQTPPQTHAWFVGSRNGIAFAVLVEGGGVGGRVAAPIAAKFAANL
ncbi:MAG: penicillin-binding transpeptidase domain-containing protein, partial [Myxococcaceae bacterium]